MVNHNIEMTKKGYAAFGAGDLDAALSIFDDSAEWTTHGDVVVVLTDVTVEGHTYHEADVYTFGGGKIVKAQSFGDTAMQERIFGSKRVAAG
jgi:ketosteroid isomerase-like protein